MLVRRVFDVSVFGSFDDTNYDNRKQQQQQQQLHQPSTSIQKFTLTQTRTHNTQKSNKKGKMEGEE